MPLESRDMHSESVNEVLAVLAPIEEWAFEVCDSKELPLRWLTARHNKSETVMTIRYAFFYRPNGGNGVVFTIDHLPDDPTADDLSAIDNLRKQHSELLKNAILMKVGGIARNERP